MVDNFPPLSSIPMQDNPAKRIVERTVALPTTDNPEEIFNSVSIIKGLSTLNDLVKIELRLRGYTYDSFKNAWKKTRSPIMNDVGIGNFMTTLQGIGDIVNFSYYEKQDIPKLAHLFFRTNYPQYVVYANEFGLRTFDLNIIKTILEFWCLSVLNNAKNAGHRNVVRGTLSEGILARALGTEPINSKKKSIFDIFKRNK